MGNVDWFDDPGWEEIQEHWRLLARLAREGGLRGLLFDPASIRGRYQFNKLDSARPQFHFDNGRMIVRPQSAP